MVQVVQQVIHIHPSIEGLQVVGMHLASEVLLEDLLRINADLGVEVWPDGELVLLLWPE